MHHYRSIPKNEHSSTSIAVKKLFKKAKASLSKGEEHVNGNLIGSVYFPAKTNAMWAKGKPHFHRLHTLTSQLQRGRTISTMRFIYIFIIASVLKSFYI